MRRPPLRLVRACAAMGLLGMLTLPAAVVRGEDLGGTAAPVPVGETVSVLRAEQAGLVELIARGGGEDRVRLALRNTTERPLNVVLPAGLVAASGAGQFGGGGGFQSMGLSAPAESPAAFGAFRDAQGGFRSVPAGTPGSVPGIALEPGQTVELQVPSICLNYGLPTPTTRNKFRLVDVEDYTADVRARKALRTLATLGTSQKVAQAVVWHVFNGMTFEQMATQAGRKLNLYELALAAQFVRSLDASGPGDVVEPAYLQQNRVFARVRGAEALANDASRLADELGQQPLLGLPVQVVDQAPSGEALISAVLLDVQVTAVTPSQVRGKLAVSYRTPQGGWKGLGTAEFQTAQEGLDGVALAEALDQAIAETFVRTRPMRREDGTTLLAVENRLPLTITDVLVPSSETDATAVQPINGLGLSPARSLTLSVPAGATRVTKIICNGL